MIAVKFQAKGAGFKNGFEAREVTRPGTWCWLIEGEEGYGVASSCQCNQVSKMPRDVKVFDSINEAGHFMKHWKGHPWYNTPNGIYEFVEVRPRMIQEGWEKS